MLLEVGLTVLLLLSRPYKERLENWLVNTTYHELLQTKLYNRNAVTVAVTVTVTVVLMADAAALLKLSETDVSQEITKEQYIPVLTNPPFVFVDGTFNTRDIGLVPGSPIRSDFAFRSGALARLTDNGRAVLEGKLGVKRVFDLRSPEERAGAPDPALQGVENTWIESTRPDSTPELDHFVGGEGEDGYREMYLEVIDVYQESWKAILEHVRDRPSDPFLVHCTGSYITISLPTIERQHSYS